LYRPAFPVRTRARQWASTATHRERQREPQEIDAA
jgi:hypothetical protein